MAAPARLVAALFGAWTLAALAVHGPELLRFYDKWSQSGISITGRRGLGSAPTKLYGVLPVRALTPASRAWRGGSPCPVH